MRRADHSVRYIYGIFIVQFDSIKCISIKRFSTLFDDLTYVMPRSSLMWNFRMPRDLSWFIEIWIRTYIFNKMKFGEFTAMFTNFGETGDSCSTPQSCFTLQCFQLFQFRHGDDKLISIAREIYTLQTRLLEHNLCSTNHAKVLTVWNPNRAAVKVAWIYLLSEIADVSLSVA